MVATALFQSGQEILAKYLSSNPVRLQEQELQEFRDWLEARSCEHAGDEVFHQKCRIRNLVRQHQRSLRRREASLQVAQEAYASSPHAGEIELSARNLARLQKGVDGLKDAVREGRADLRKLAAYRRRLREQQGLYSQLVARSPEKRRLDRADTSLARLRDDIGLSREEARLKRLQQSRGRRTGTAGRRFEQTAAMAIDRLIVPQFSALDAPVVHLRSVTLGCARGEFDHLIVRDSPNRDVVEVLALVETKRNVNDVADGFLIRQENLAWLTGDASGYEPFLYRTRFFPKGHFDRPATHRQDGRTWRFDHTSFAGFRRDARTRHFLSAICFVTTSRPLLGVTGRELATILHWVATDPDFDLANDTVLRRFRKRVTSFIDPFQTRDVLDLYRLQSLGGQIVFCSW